MKFSKYIKAERSTLITVIENREQFELISMTMGANELIITALVRRGRLL